jgi:hypothetical protein
MQTGLRMKLFQQTHSFWYCLFNVVFLVLETLQNTTLQIKQISVQLVAVAFLKPISKPYFFPITSDGDVANKSHKHPLRFKLTHYLEYNAMLS